MLAYFLQFTILGAAISHFSKDFKEDLDLVIIVIIGVLWSLQFGAFWALVSLAEMMLGRFIVNYFEDKKNNVS